MASRTMKLTLIVKYERDSDPSKVPSEKVCRQLLGGMVDYAVDEGTLTPDGEYVVDDYRYEIECVATTND